MQAIASIKDLQALARKRAPKAFYDYADSGSYSEQTYHRNNQAFQNIFLRQRVAINVEHRSTQTHLLGQPVTMPLALAPTGLTGMQWADGEILAAKAAHAFGVPFTLSTMSICSLETVAAATQKPFWFQLYVMRDRAFNAQLIDRAKAAGCSALVITLDLQVMGQRHKDIKNGLTVPPRLTLPTVFDLLRKPRWVWNMLQTKNRTFGNIVDYVQDGTDMRSLGNWVANQFDPTLSWDDVAWMKERWGGPLILKGILDPADAKMALQIGADAIVVSNHGGRQLDGALASIEVLPAIAAEVGHKLEVWLDGGIQQGQDIYKALALGAKGTLIGRTFLYGLAAMGQAGVEKALQILHKELDITMALTGVNTISEISRSNLIQPH